MNYYLKFTVSSICFAAPIEEIKEIARPKTISQKSKITKNFIGFFELRKKRVPLYDLPKLLKIEPSDKFEVIISEINQKHLGFKVDKVLGIITTKDLTPFPDLVEPEDYFKGVIKEGDNLVQVLSFTKLISGSRLRAIKKYL